MDPGLAAILGAAVGAVGSGGIQWVAGDRDRRERRQQHRRGILESALHNAQRERRLLHTGYSMWRHGAPREDVKVQENDREVVAAIEAVWISESQVLVEFGESSQQWAAYQVLLDAVIALKRVYDRGIADPVPSPAAHQDWIEAANTMTRAQMAFAAVIRETK